MGIVHCPAYKEVIDPLVRRSSELTHEEIAPFVEVSAEEFARPFEFDDDLGHSKWALAAAKSYRDSG